MAIPNAITPGVQTDQTLVGAQVAGLDTRISALENAQGISGTSPVTAPEPRNPFITSYERIKAKFRATESVNIPAETDTLVTRMIRQADRTDQATFDASILQVEMDVDEDSAAAGIFEQRMPIRLEASTTYDLVQLIAKGTLGKIKNPPSGIAFNDPPLATFTTPDPFGSPSGPNASLVMYNELDPATPEFDAHIGLKVYAPLTDAGAAQTYAQAGVDWVKILLTRNYSTSAGTQKIPEERLLDATELTQVDAISTPVNRGFVVIDCPGLKPGATYVWTENTVHTNDGKKTTSGSVSINAAQEQTDVTQLTNTALTVSTSDPYDGKHVRVAFEFSQPSTVVALRNFSLQRKKASDTDFDPPVVDRNHSVQSDLFHRVSAGPGTIQITNASKNVVGTGTTFTNLLEGWKIKVGAQTLTIGTITDDTHLTVTTNSSASASGQSYTIVYVLTVIEEMKVKPSTSYNLRFVLRPRKDGTKSVFTLTFSTSASGEVDNDTAVPTLSTNPDTSTTGPTVQERHSHIHVSCPVPSANINTLDNYQVVLSTQNTPPAGTPSVGSEGVVKIKNGQDVTFGAALTASLTTDFYLYFRAHNSVGFSLWSAGTNQHGYSRPIQDFIGTGVPTQALGLERSTTGGSSGNSTTTYVLDGSASAVTDFYANMHLHIPSLAASNRVRKITAYNASTKTVTVDVAWSVTPGNSLTFEIHRGMTFGEKSGTGHTTTTFVLGAAADTSTDHSGKSLYFPAQASGDQIRLIKTYVPATKTATIDAVSSASSANDCYMLSQGSFGFAAINPFSGIIAGVPFRVWQDDDTNVLEIIMPTGENAFSIQFIQVEVYRKSNGAFKKKQSDAPSSESTVRIPASSSYVPTYRMRMQNLFRDGGSDGWSAFTYYVEGFQTGVGASVAYDPGTYVPVAIDYQAPGSYPSSRYSGY